MALLPEINSPQASPTSRDGFHSEFGAAKRFVSFSGSDSMSPVLWLSETLSAAGIGPLESVLTVLALTMIIMITIQMQWRNRRQSSGPLSDGSAQLKQILHDLQASSLATRAGKDGTKTLKNLWRLNNPFVSASPYVQKEYRTALLRAFASGNNGESWAKVVAATSEAIKPLLLVEDSGTAFRCNIKEVSRRATLAAILQSLFDIHGVQASRLEYIGCEVHRLTVAKKHFDAGNPDVSSLPKELQVAADRLIVVLRDMFKDATQTSPLAKHILCNVSGSEADFNPLDLVIPAFEAPWRGTYYTLLALLQSPSADKMEDIEILRACRDATDPPARALAICYESLRLYPPIRRVRRQGRVDVEAIQRHPLFWGPDADRWNPGRFLDVKGEIKKELLRPTNAWLPFATGSMMCPSSQGYSVRLLTVVVGAVLREICGEPGTPVRWRLEGPEWLEKDTQGQLLRAGRDEYASVDVVVSQNEQQRSKRSYHSEQHAVSRR